MARPTLGGFGWLRRGIAAAARQRRLVALLVAALGVAAATAGTIEGLHRAAPFPPAATAVELPPGPMVSCADPIPVPGGRIASTELVRCPRQLDGATVTYVGEAIGEVLRRDGGAWVQLNDDTYALRHGPLPAHRRFSGGNTGLAVWLPDPLWAQINQTGGPNHRGDVLLVTGVVHATDPADGGGLTLRATDARVLQRGGPVPAPVHRAQAVAAGVLALIAAALIAAERVRAARR